MPALETLDDPFLLAQELQLSLAGQPFERRMELAVGSLRALGFCAYGLQTESARFLVDCRMAIIRPEQANAPRVHGITFGSIALEGTFDDFSYFSLGKLEQQPVNSICAGFTDVTLLPDGDMLPVGDVLRVPVLAIDQKLRIH